MRLLFLAGLTALAHTALAEPVLVIEGDKYAKEFKLRVIAPDGALVVQYEKGLVGTDSDWAAPGGWYRGAGRYGVVGVLTRDRGETLMEGQFEVTEADKRLEWSTFGKLTHLRDGDARVRAVVSPDLRDYRVDNESPTPVLAGPRFAAHIRLERQEGSAWHLAGEESQVNDLKPGIPPGSSRTFSINWVAHSDLVAGRYRIVTAYDLESESKDKQLRMREAFAYEVTSAPVDYAPGTIARPCEQRSGSWHSAYSAPKSQAYLSLDKTAAGFILTKNSGERLRINEQQTPLAPVLPGSHTLVSSDGRTVLVYADPARQISADGGLTFQSIGPATLKPGNHWVLAGERLFEFGSDGNAVWRLNDGSSQPVALPVRAEWRAAAFRDTQHGVLIGECSVLLETADGGQTWTTEPADVDIYSRVVWRKDELYFSNKRGLFVRHSDKATFDQVLQGSYVLQPDGNVAFGERPHAALGPDHQPVGPIPLIPIYLRQADGSFRLLPQDHQFGRLNSAMAEEDGSVLLFLTLTSRVERLKDGHATVVLDGKDPDSIREATEAAREFMKQFGGR